ncbi:hypothetical protein QWY84_03820 [Aquisalimonas lutea]|uniref:hypothetical protein n=1 Tax=Aquisalimonas lutea TaxID=1327750 RepID=UPI0025B3749A|nr:hypothetical protein [Aquisalimonas lutea]MDN3516733.1 hypothetical protein [Aquisalimonas lutea]
MLKKTLYTAVLAGLAVPAAAGAQEFSYDYVQGGWAVYPDADPGDQSYVGLDAEGRYALNQDFFLLGGFQYLTDDVDYTTFHGGGALRLPIDTRTDAWAGATIEYQDYDPGGDDTSIGLRGGIRHMVNDDLEVSGELRAVTGDADYWGLRGTATYYVRSDLALSGSVDLFDGDPGLLAGARFMF